MLYWDTSDQFEPTGKQRGEQAHLRRPDMDRQYLAPHKVRVFNTLTDVEQGLDPVKVVEIVPHSHCGFDNYLIDGVPYPGYVFGSDPLDACVYLDRPLFKKPA